MMRIQSSFNLPFITQQKSSIQSSDLFKSTLLEKELEKQEDKKGKIVTAREGAYVRQYVVHEDGTKILLSETKTAGEDSMSTAYYQHPLSNQQRVYEDGMGENTKNIMSLLNLQVADISVQSRYENTSSTAKGT